MSILFRILTSSQSHPQAVAKREVNNRLSFGSSQGLTLKDCYPLLNFPNREQANLPADSKQLLGCGRDKLVICCLWPEMSMKKKTEKGGEFT